MRKSVHGSNSKCVCKKIFGISVTCPVCKSAATSQLSLQEKLKPKAEMTTQTKVAARRSEPSNSRANLKVGEKEKQPKLEANLAKRGRTASLQGYNDAFSDYITREGIRIRAMSNVGIVKIASGSAEYDTKKEDSKDTFSVFINRASMKIRKASSIGSRNIISFKRE